RGFAGGRRWLEPRSLVDLRRFGADCHRTQLRRQADRQAASTRAGGFTATGWSAQLAELSVGACDFVVCRGDGDDAGRAARGAGLRSRVRSLPGPPIPGDALPIRRPGRRRARGRAGLDRPALAMKVGIVGLPNAGKSTLFNALTKGGAQTGDYPFTTIEPNVAIAQVPDGRL